MVGAHKPAKEGISMAKTLAALMVLASFLLVAPVIESATSGTTQMFQTFGTADDGGGGGD